MTHGTMYRLYNMFYNLVSYTAEYSARREKRILRKGLYKAIMQGELLLHYQPKVDGRTGSLVGMEALVRWQHPHRGLLMPVEFIPLAEETGLIISLDEWVLRKACEQFKQWSASGPKGLKLAVNMSAKQFRKQQLPEKVAEILKDTGLEPSHLELEITETVAMESTVYTLDTIKRLMNMGVTISVDDFGTGYSSFNYLKKLPLSSLKIDRSFVADLLTDKNTYMIVKAIVDVSHSLNLKVVAEGVETREQLVSLLHLGCDELQGFYMSKPLTEEEVESCLLPAI